VLLCWIKLVLDTDIILDKLDGTPMLDQVKLVSVHLETVLMSMQDRCIICVECVIGLEIVLDAPDRTPR
jgi:enamine deaminase RidA (YjgF/YER057c/UK114 family)